MTTKQQNKNGVNSFNELVSYSNTADLPVVADVGVQEVREAAKTKDYIVTGQDGKYRVSDVENEDKKWTVKAGVECDCTQFEKQNECAHVRAVVLAASNSGLDKKGNVCARCHHDSVDVCKGHLKEWDYRCEICTAEGVSKRKSRISENTYDGPIFG